MARAMKRRSKVTGKPVKLRRHKACKQKRQLAPNEASRPTASAVGKDEQIARLTHERDEAHSSTGSDDRHPTANQVAKTALSTILENAVRICDASFGDIGQLEDGVIRLLAMHLAITTYSPGLDGSPAGNVSVITIHPPK
jgi:hypothetical protein